MQTAAALLLVAAGLGLSGCPGELDPRLLNPGPTVCDGEALLASAKCSMAGCHFMTVPAGDLDLFSPGVIQRLVGRMPTPTSTSCSTITTPYLTAGSNPATGLLLDKLQMTPMCGLAMPYPGLMLLPANEIACLQEWSTAVTTGMIQ
jgi:hypothetical protein